jgi:hypothetical protein
VLHACDVCIMQGAMWSSSACKHTTGDASLWQASHRLNHLQVNSYDVYIMQGHQVMITSLQAYNAMS